MLNFFVLHSSYVPHAIVLFVPKVTNLMKDWETFSLTTRKSAYPQYPVKLKSPSGTKSKKMLRINSGAPCAALRTMRGWSPIAKEMW